MTIEIELQELSVQVFRHDFLYRYFYKLALIYMIVQQRASKSC